MTVSAPFAFYPSKLLRLMQLALLTALAMLAFAANSLLNRAGVEHGGIGPMEFALVRVAGGALVLAALVAMRGGRLPLWQRGRVLGAVSLTAYMIGFSGAYLALDAGLGALILFGVVQVSMFAWASWRGAVPKGRQLAGAALAFGGLAWLLWPGGAAPVDAPSAALMVIAGVGWAAYTLSGRTSPDPLGATAANFLLCLPLTGLAVLAFGAGNWALPGVLLAMISGGLTSGLGYALWYAVLPRIEAGTAAVVQLSVPVIALATGALLLGESLGPRLLLAGAIVLAGIALALTESRAPTDRSQTRD